MFAFLLSGVNIYGLAGIENPMSNKRLLLLSNGSELVGDEPTEFARGALRDFLGASARRVLFVPFAAVIRTYDEYAARVRKHCLVAMSTRRAGRRAGPADREPRRTSKFHRRY